MTTLPGNAVGAGRAVTVGENEFAPPPTAFSVGDGALGDAGALELCDGAVVSAGFSLVPVLQALNAPIPTMAIAPVASANRRVNVDDMVIPLFFARTRLT